MLNVHLNLKVEKKLSEFKKSKTPMAHAAKKAEHVICGLVSGKSPSSAGILNKNGESRIKNCMKYDLGNGYRLVCIKYGDDVYVVYLGNHDSSKVWIDNHKHINQAHIHHEADLFNRVEQMKSDCPISLNIPPVYDPVEGDMKKEISQGDLRKVFKGLVS